ncbi:MAG: type II toxin-antitoxin system Phd/YefM family antitoxin [Candidatus Competibacteraceae bacterium]
MSTVPEETMSSVVAREHFSELLDRVAVEKERIILTRRGKAVVAVVPVEDMELLEALEKQHDLRAFRAAKEEFERSGEAGVPLDEVLAEFGIKR